MVVGLRSWDLIPAGILVNKGDTMIDFATSWANACDWARTNGYGDVSMINQGYKITYIRDFDDMIWALTENYEQAVKVAAKYKNVE